ncbi:hypothetical protein ACROYT_G021030 [Oculina patagonica]
MFAKRERAAGRGLVEDNGAFSSPEAAILLVSTREIAATIAASGDQMEEDIRAADFSSVSLILDYWLASLKVDNEPSILNETTTD